MMAQTNKLSFINIFAFTILVFVCHYSYETNTFGKLCITNINQNNTSNIRASRLLYSETDIDFNKRYNYLKKNALKIVNEDEYNFGNKLNTLLGNFYLPKEFKTLLFDEKVQKSLNSKEFMYDIESSSDSLKFDDYRDIGSVELKEKHIQKKKCKSKKKSTSSSIFSSLKILDSIYERNIEKLFGTENKKSNKYNGISGGSSIKYMFKVFSPIIIGTAIIFIFALMKWFPAIAVPIILTILASIYICVKVLKVLYKSINKS
ncbi:Plasmodium exported protein, unknown function [Plasmodium malariae]|uniref:Pv-fam-d protein n=1 Tax=Plasmodium malariae TaxID=5858 RepID=A0A1D3SMG9_PLAMA|nr:Plasmodium exported protein, unknown function [Plasmodium malariae]SCO92905.1 Plasmodium exported protein, unknown function [Plasmodium malariae]